MKTINIKPLTSIQGQVDFHVWQTSEGWWSCRTGEFRGVTVESDDLGPFDSEEEAFDAQTEDFDNYMDMDPS